jgi:hypothetical protein
MTHLLSKSLRRDLHLELPENIVGDSGGFYGGKLIQPIFSLSREYVSFVRPEALIAWVFSRRLPPLEGVSPLTPLTLPLSPLPSLLLDPLQNSSRYQVQHLEVTLLPPTMLPASPLPTRRGIRELYQTSYYLWDIGLHLRERLVFKQPAIPSLEEVDLKPKTSFRVSCQIGTASGGAGGAEEGTNIYWKFSRVENLPNHLASLLLPKDIGSGVVIDLTRRLVLEGQGQGGQGEEGSPEQEAYLAKTCSMIKQAILHHFGDELQRTPHFRGVFVFPTTNETDQMKVIRICLGFKRTISVDSFLKMAGVPYGTDDLIGHCYGEISSNLHLTEIVENLYTAFDTSFFLNVPLPPLPCPAPPCLSLSLLVTPSPSPSFAGKCIR